MTGMVKRPSEMSLAAADALCDLDGVGCFLPTQLLLSSLLVFQLMKLLLLVAASVFTHP